MNDISATTAARVIEVESVIPLPPQVVWKTLTSVEAIGQWIKMPLAGFEPVRGNRFTFRTTPAGAWDGLIHCEIVDVLPHERLAYTWEGGDEGNVGYGSRLETLVTWKLASAPGGTRLRLTHAGFISPRNDATHQTLRGGWEKVVQAIGQVAAKVGAPS